MDAHHDEHGPIGEHVEGIKDDRFPSMRLYLTLIAIGSAALAFAFIFRGMGYMPRKAAEVVCLVSLAGGLVALVVAIISLWHRWVVQGVVLLLVVILAAVAFIIAQPFALT